MSSHPPPKVLAAMVAGGASVVALLAVLVPPAFWGSLAPAAGVPPQEWLADLVDRAGGGLAQFGVLALATLVSEDLTCIASGVVARDTELSLLLAIAGACTGIWVGDMGLYLIGRLAGAGTGWDQRPSMQRWHQRFDRNAALVVIASRFMPGTRTPLYIAIGACGGSLRIFAWWSAIAVGLWTPLVVLASWWFGGEILQYFHESGVNLWWVLPLLVLGMILGLRLLSALVHPDSRRGLLMWSRRWLLHEFHPPWLFYLPLVPVLFAIAARHRGLLAFTAANPCLPAGGVVGESKAAIARLLPARWTLPTALVAPGPQAQRLAHAERVRAFHGWDFPLILKPDAGQRGVGLRRVADAAALAAALAESPDPVVLQPCHPGPHEVGLFYVREPGRARGRIISVTEKVFPEILGDGQRSLAQLVWRHPRYRLQYGVFARRHAERWGWVPAAGEHVVLARAGNHAQGTLFRDGAHLLTPQLEARIDAIARSIPGFSFGRFDIRYRDPEAFAAGEELCIIELNGVTSECTNIYDPSWSPLRRYALLVRQWNLAYRCGRLWRERGVPVLGSEDLVRLLFGFYRHRRTPAGGD